MRDNLRPGRLQNIFHPLRRVRTGKMQGVEVKAKAGAYFGM